MSAIWPFMILAIPLVTAGASLVPLSTRRRLAIHIMGLLATSASVFALAATVTAGGAMETASGFFFVDPLSAVLLLVVTLVTLISGLHSIGYVRQDVAHGELSVRQERQYFAWFHAFTATMYLVLMVNNLGITWVAIEGTTVTSAFLVAIYRKAEALEAAWKYLILCSSGIAFALLGLIFLYSSAQDVYGPGSNRLDFTFLARTAHALPTPLLLTSFALIFVGYGTKVGLAPLHFWLPDAHSQAPSPVSALLSGALLNTALYGIMRIVILLLHTASEPFVVHLSLVFGLLSLAVAFPFLLLQQDIKRMLAFSSVEQMGILLFGIGVGTEASFFAVILQLFNHAMTKSTLFMTAGNLVQQYRTKQIPRIRGVLSASPFSGTVLLVAGLALVGAPPFAIFSSELAITAAGFAAGHPFTTALFLLLLAALFGATLYQLGRMVFGTPTAVRMTHPSRWTTWPLLLPLALATVLGVWMPHPLSELFQGAARVMDGRLL